MLELPTQEKAYWHQTHTSSTYPQLEGTVEADVVIVGGGITGLTTAYLLKQAGLKVIVLEKRTVGAGTTGRTTGKVTSQHNLIYADLYQRLGEKVARTYGQANQQAVEQVEKIIKQAKIDCDWQRDDNYVYTAQIYKVAEFKKEQEIAARLGLPASFERGSPLPFEIKAAVKFSNQAKFHSQKYLLGLARAVEGSGSRVFEKSNVRRIRAGSRSYVGTNGGRIYSKHIVIATNVPTMPLAARGLFCFLEYPTESYIVAGRLNRQLEGMYISPDKRHYSILPVQINGERMLLVGGESNISGVRSSKKKRYQRLADYAAKHFQIKSIDYMWSDRDYLTYDGVPLVGRLYPWTPNLYVATAFRKWGLSNGTVAAMILSDLIIGKSNPWAPIFTSNRLSPVASIPRVAFKYLTGQN